MRALSLIVVALLGVAHAAPAPFAMPGPEQVPVDLTGTHADPSLVDHAPPAIGSKAEYQAAVRAWGIANPPRVNFRTHVLVVVASKQPLGEAPFEVRDGDLLVPRPVTHGFDGVVIFDGPQPVDAFNYRLKSFPRAAVRSVNGQPVPKE